MKLPDYYLKMTTLPKPESAAHRPGLFGSVYSKMMQWAAHPTTLFSVLGGILGYLIGVYGGDLVHPLIVRAGWQHSFDLVLGWFAHWGFWAVFIAGFSPVPYKLFTIGAGVLGLAFTPFIAASVIGRGARFFLESCLVARAGPAVVPLVERNMERAGWIMVILIVIAGTFYYLQT